jgi:hypothetical protein
LNILFAMASPEYLRFYDGTIRELAARGHRVSIACNKDRENKPVRLEGMSGESSGVIVLGLVPRRAGAWGAIGRGLRGLTDFARYLHPRFVGAPVLRARMKRKVLPRGFRWLDGVRTVGERGSRWLMRCLAACEAAIPSSTAIERFISHQDADLVLVSPLVDAGSDQVELVKSAQALGVPVGACIASWDNLTNKGVLRVEPDRVFVWNEAQRREAVEFHAVSPDRVEVTGAQLFDRWFERRVDTSREVFCQNVGLVADRPFILFTCSSSFISISHAEVAFVRAWVEALRAGPALGEVGVLVRPHPYNCHAWEAADLSDLVDVAVWPRRAYNPVDEGNRGGFFDSLFHSAAVVGINTSAMIEAAILDKPVLSLAAGEFFGTQEGTLHFHHLLPEHGGFLRMAYTLPEHVAQLADVMARPDVARADTDRFVRSFIRPHGIDRAATPILVDAVVTLGGTTRKARHLAWWAPALWPVLFGGAALAGGWLLLVEPKARGGLRKRLAGRRHRAGKRVARGGRLALRQVRRLGCFFRPMRRAVSPRAVGRSIGLGAKGLVRRVRHVRYAASMRVRHRRVPAPPDRTE